MDLREQFIKSAMRSCRHFNGTQNEKCKAGITYRKWNEVTNEAMPCLPSHINGRPTWPCDLFEIMSVADAEKEADERLILVEKGMKARHAAKDDAQAKQFGKGRGGVGEIACPSCDGGRLRYSVAGYNGHMHGKCSTPGCVSWME